jgi:glyoxylase I family protein
MQTTTQAPITIRTPGVHHIALRSTDLERSRRFYIDLLGFAPILEAEGIFLFLAGSTAIGVRAPTPEMAEGDRFSPLRVGLDHVALACEDEAELGRVAAALSKAGVDNTGVKLDETLGKRYVAFKDPDGIAWELYMV